MTPPIHLVNIAPPFREGFANMKRPPSGILYVGGHLKRNGFPVSIHHILEKEIEGTVDRILAGERPLFVGFSLMTGKQVALSARMSESIKNRDPGVRIVWGGIHPSLLPAECVALPFVDFVIVGEGEEPSLSLARALVGKGGQEEVPGLAFRKDGDVTINPPQEFRKNLDLYRQDWALVDLQRYVRNNFDGSRGFYFITSRGCPHSCGFCYNQNFNLRRWRAHSADFVLKELLNIRDLTDIDVVAFDDDNFFTDRKRGIEILRRLKEEGIHCRWVELRVDYVTEDLVSELCGLGVQSIFMGWESGSEETLRRITKEFSPELIIEKVRILSRFKDLTVDASAIVGFPWETVQDMEKTVSLALRMFEINPFRMNFNIGLYVPYPGAPITKAAEERGFRFPNNCQGWSRFDILSGEMELPWMGRKVVRRYHLIDKYAKLLYVFPFLKFPIRQAAYAAAGLAYLRLKTRLLFFPWEVWLSDWYKRRKFARMEEGG